MNENRRPPPPVLQSLRDQVKVRWQSLSERDRVGVLIAAGVLLCWLIWSIALVPALKTWREAPAQIEELDLQLQSMRGLAAEARELRGAVPVPTVQALDALRSATARLGDKGHIATQGERITLSVNGVSGEQLRAWLSEARSGAHARPIEAQLTRGANGYAGTLIVTIGNASSS